ncbi:hypothetical protein SUGI_1137910 [Cryptomeria japonica]|uniref:U11/U12 small nuclear ribonucleoprotein 65 kDa protein n=1 Tax=Cryptomeria japonica TaxID=3369 RepID=UPI002414A425|nr:U11/U12 small nuclear ribonucleoprotein 65 kDa protein [Cryptomeria japonica]XP_057830144.2 U11/U12 small nuclear ribonucleoprotein 65 kDa protein [Cryptomeria japonica]GLJ53369.1 hypothetical protein SUGI_1137910 [Cryptomeria japonica]
MAAQVWNRNENESGGRQDDQVTLIVKHLPEALPEETLMRLFSYYGASAVRPCVAGRLKNSAFIDFENEATASRAKSQLNRLRFLGKILSVERAEPLNSVGRKEGEAEKQDPPLSKENQQLTGDGPKFVGEPIAPTLGIDYPFPPHLEYAYPPPDGNILTNIVNALIAVPRFYTQVLHLMNKMNLPAPFRPALPTPPLPTPPLSTQPLSTSSFPNRSLGDLSSEESELESSEEECFNDGKTLTGSVELDKRQSGAKPTSVLRKELVPVKKKRPVLQIKIKATPSGQPCDSSTKENKDVEDTEMEIGGDEEAATTRLFATPAELEAGKLPLTELLVLPMFKNYSPGNPSPVLYIKNLAKDVVVDDFSFVFGSLFGSLEEAKSRLGIKLMHEGRMKHQAFVTFPSTELARFAFEMVQGFVLKGKAMIIQFGRSHSAGKAT